MLPPPRLAVVVVVLLRAVRLLVGLVQPHVLPQWLCLSGVDIYLVRTRALTIHQTRTRRGYGVVTAVHNVVVVPRKT